MCTEGGRERKRGEAGARQGSRMGVLIKPMQIAAQQMLFLFCRHKDVVGGHKDCLRYFRVMVPNLSPYCKSSSLNNFKCCLSMRGCECLGGKSIPCSALTVNVILKVHVQVLPLWLVPLASVTMAQVMDSASRTFQFLFTPHCCSTRRPRKARVSIHFSNRLDIKFLWNLMWVKKVLIWGTSSCMMENPEMVSFYELLQAYSG